MEESKREHFKKKLEEMRAEIISDVEKTLSDMTSQSTAIPDPNDRATMETDRSFELRLRDRERKLLEKIDEAMERIMDGSFGVCESCGEDVGEKRLEARPVAQYCIDCKTAQEQKEKAQGL